MPDFLPRRDADLLQWSVVFNHELSTDAEGCGLREEDAQAYSLVHAEYALAYVRAKSAETGTRSGTITKNAKRKALKILARRLAKIVRASPQVSMTQRVKLGLKETKPRRRYVPMPDIAPGVMIVDFQDKTVTLRLFDPASPTRRGKPAGASCALVYVHYGQITSEDPINRGQVHNTSKIHCRIKLAPSIKPGDPIYIAARWLGTRQQPGPMSRVMPVQIQLTREIIVPVMKEAA